MDKRVFLSFGITSAAGGLLGAPLHARFSSTVLSYVLGALLVFAGIMGITGLSRRMRFEGAVTWIAGTLIVLALGVALLSTTGQDDKSQELNVIASFAWALPALESEVFSTQSLDKRACILAGSPSGRYRRHDEPSVIRFGFGLPS